MRKPRVIIFDDDVMMLNMFAVFFFDRGFEVLTFKEPVICPLFEKQAARCDKENPCTDILITDFEMPRINGLELLQRQAQLGCRLDVRNKAIISGTIDMVKGNKEIIDSLGCVYFKKPFRLSMLSDWIDERKKSFDLSRPLGTL